MNLKKLATVCFVSFAALIAQAAYSQDQLGEIVVTAQKRTENQQNVPISITAITGTALQTSGVNTTTDLGMAVPGMVLPRQTSAALIFLRGVGTQGGTLGQDPAVATFIDGVYVVAITGTQFALNDIERLEVLKGPQGTLYGRNATGGAINIITREPSETPSIEASVGYGNLYERDASLYATGRIAPNLVADIAASYDQDDGFGRNIYSGQNVNARKDEDVRSKWLWTPTDKTKVTLGMSYNYADDSQALRPQYGSLPVTGELYTGSWWDTDQNVNPRDYTKSVIFSLKVGQEMDWANFLSISAWQRARQMQWGDLDATPVRFLDFPLFSTDEYYTQELQLSSLPSSKLTWIAGAFFLNGWSSYDPYQLYGLLLDPALMNPNAGESQWDTQKTKSYSGYAQATYPITDNTNFTLGGRYTHDERQIYDTTYAAIYGIGPVGPGAQTTPQEATFAKPTWRVGFDHHFTQDTMAYVSYNRGFKSGTYNMSSPSSPPVQPETIDAYELGVKSDLFDHRVRINSSIFYYKYNEIQLSQLLGATQLLLNAASGKIYGLDFDGQALITENFTVTLAGEYLHARYENFPGAPFYWPNYPPGGPYSNPLQPFGNNVLPQNASGNNMLFSPEGTTSLAGDYHFPFLGGVLDYNATFYYNSGYYFGPDNLPGAYQRAYELVNSQVRWTSPSTHYNVTTYVTNAFNREYYAQISEGALVNLVAPSPGRQFGVRFGIKF